MIFGGQGETEKPEVDQPYETLDDLVIWDTEQEKWELPQLEVAEGVRRPAARHAHLSAVVSFNTTPHSPATIASSPSLSPFDILAFNSRDYRRSGRLQPLPPIRSLPRPRIDALDRLATLRLELRSLSLGGLQRENVVRSDPA